MGGASRGEARPAAGRRWTGLPPGRVSPLFSSARPPPSASLICSFLPVYISPLDLIDCSHFFLQLPFRFLLS
jgi:hypothetical protein